MCWLGGSTHGIDRRVLKEQQYIPLSLRNPFFLQLFLKCPCLGIGNRLRKPDKRTRLWGRCLERLTPLSWGIVIRV
jgi:hypothetical protein